MGQYKYMPKMESTEESVVLKLKKGGMAKKAMGGAMPIRNEGRVAGAMAPTQAAEMAKARGRAALMSAPAMARPSAGMPAQAMGKKKGGEVESKSMEAKEEREIQGIKKELKAHESKPASKGHKGLKTGGIAKYATGGIIQKYKDGGHVSMSGDTAGFKATKKGGCW